MTTEDFEALHALSAYARRPLNGKLPIGPMPISPEMASPATLPVKAKVSGIGLVIEIFQATSSPLTVPSKISPLLPSADCVPVSVLPALFSASSALRSPIGVLMVMFQFPSTAIDVSLWSPVATGMVRDRDEFTPACHSTTPRRKRRRRRSRDQARAARIRLVTRMRNAAYCTAKAATLAPIATTET